MQDIMNKNSYYKIRILFYEFVQKQSKKFEINFSSLLYEILSLISICVLLLLFTFVILFMLRHTYPINTDIATFFFQSDSFLFMLIAHFFVLKQQRKDIINEVGEEYRILFLSQIDYSQDFSLKNAILFRKFLDTKQVFLSKKEIISCFRYMEKTRLYNPKENQNLLKLLQASIYRICTAFVFYLLKARTRIFYNTLMSYKELYCKE